MENKIKLNVEEKVLRISIPTDNGVIVVNNPSDKSIEQNFVVLKLQILNVILFILFLYAFTIL